MPEIIVRQFSGDGSGIFDVISGTRVYIHEDIVRMRTMVNYVVKNGGELVLPQLTELVAKRSPCFEVHGGVYGVRELRIYASRAQLHRSGHSGCFSCSSKLDGKYWFEKIVVKSGGTLEVISAVKDVRKAVQLHTATVAVEYNGVLTSDAIEMFTKYLKTDHDARFDSSSRVTGGPGAGSTCGYAGGGAGHGGIGGRGSGCGCSGYAYGKPR